MSSFLRTCSQLPSIGPTNPLVTSLLTDMYQITMAYAYFKSNRHNTPAVFDLFFRKNPFGGEFTVFAGLSEVIRVLHSWKMKKDDIEYLKTLLPTVNENYFEWLASLDCSQVRVTALKEGTICFPREPLIRVEGPLAICQLLETTLLNCVNFPTLIATNAARFRIAAGNDKTLIEFGLRRAQGPDGAITAARYSYIGGFDGTSNVRAGQLFGMDVKGTHAHSFVTTFRSLTELHTSKIVKPGEPEGGVEVEFLELVHHYRNDLRYNSTNEGELAAFVNYAQCFPSGFLALCDTYDTLSSGVKNFIVVALALDHVGYRALGIRLDSGDLAYLSQQARKMFREVGTKYNKPNFGTFTIFASNEINEQTIMSLNAQKHECNAFGVGTHLVTCQGQPALGGVYKLVEIDGHPRIKLSQEISKITIPCRKNLYRLYNVEGVPMLDLMTMSDEEPPKVGERILCRHPFDEVKRAFVVPSRVETLLEACFTDGKCTSPLLVPIDDTRDAVKNQLSSMRPDHLRSLNPTPYKVSVTTRLYEFLHELWLQETPVMEMS